MCFLVVMSHGYVDVKTCEALIRLKRLSLSFQARRVGVQGLVNLLVGVPFTLP